jgi:hypothetical protein
MNAPENHLHVQFDPQVPNLKADLSKLEKLVWAICEKFEIHNATVHISIVDDAGIIEKCTKLKMRFYISSVLV